MVQRSRIHELEMAWRALSSDQILDGWRTIPIVSKESWRLLGGRKSPGNYEGVLIGLPATRMPSIDQLPKGIGFNVSKAILGDASDGFEWMALARHDTGSVELFTIMAEDVISVLEDLQGASSEKAIRAFLARVRAWQNFMQRDDNGIMGAEAELGLYGELELLNQLIEEGLPHNVVIDAWQGPFDGVQDFRLGSGAIEVKTTTANKGFVAKIGSLEQLDDTLIYPIFLAAIKVSVSDKGLSLTEKITELRYFLRDDVYALSAFNGALLNAGFLDCMSENYTRKFLEVNTRFITVDKDFPCLTRTNVTAQVLKVRYEIDVDLIVNHDISLTEILKRIGVMLKWS